MINLGTVVKIKNLFYLLLLSIGLTGCDNEPIKLELIQSPLDVTLTILPNFSNEFVEDRPVDILINIENIRVELTTYNVRVLDAVTRTPLLFIEEPYPGSATSFSLTLPPFKAGLYSVIVTVTDVNDFQSAASSNVAIPAVAFQEGYEDLWFKGTSNQWQNNIKFDQIDNHVWQAECVSLAPGEEFILSSNLSNSDCYWGGGGIIDLMPDTVALPVFCDSINYVYNTQIPFKSEVPSGQYSLRFDDISNELVIIPNDGCISELGRAPMKVAGSAVTNYFPGADYFKITNQQDQLVTYFENGTFELVENDGSGTTWGGLGGDGQLVSGGAPISIEEGLYHLSLDADTKQLVITRINEISIVGDLDWSLDRPLAQDPLNPWIWKVSDIALESGNIRFRANQSWEVSWGDPDLDILLSYGGGNIEVSGGTYDVTINVLANNYLIE